MQDIRSCTKNIGKYIIETTAYVCALGIEKGLDMDKYRDQVEKELDVQSTLKKGDLNSTY